MSSGVTVVLFEPQDPINIGATVRAMKNMGVSDLRLVRPVAYEPERLETIAHDSRDLVQSITHFDSLDAALVDISWACAFTARKRSAKREVVDARRCAALLSEKVASGRVALVFGREDRGLGNDELDRANVVATIPTTSYASLNLAQAVMVALYEVHVALGLNARVVGQPRKDAPPATMEEYERLFADVETALRRIDFFKTRYPPPILRSVRSLAFRADPDAREISLLRAIAIEVVRAMEREVAAARKAAAEEGS